MRWLGDEEWTDFLHLSVSSNMHGPRLCSSTKAQRCLGLTTHQTIFSQQAKLTSAFIQHILHPQVLPIRLILKDLAKRGKPSEVRCKGKGSLA